MDISNTSLVELIKAFNAPEYDEIAHFLASPMFNPGKNAPEFLKLFQAIAKTAPTFSKDLLQKEQVYFQVFADKQIVPGKLEKLMTHLSQQLRLYAVVQGFLAENNETKRQVEWAAWLRSRNLGERAFKVLEKLQGKRAEDRKESLDLYRTDLLIAEERHIWESTHNQAKGDLYITQLIYHLDRYYQTYRTELQNRYLLQKKVAQLPGLEEDMEHIHATNPESLLLKLTQNISRVLSQEVPPMEETQALMTYLQQHEEAIDYETLDNLYAYLRNFYSLLINNNNEQFLPILHQLNQDNLARGFFFIHGKLSHLAYLNLVIVALRVKDYAWARKITEQYKDFLVNGDEGQFYYKLNMVYCLFAEKLFEEALNWLPDPPAHSIYHQKIRRLELQLYYELNSELLTYKIDAFRKYNERTASKSISANLREMNVNFLNILLQLSQSPPKDKARAAQLIKRIQGKRLMAERGWLLEKARELG